MTKHIIILHLSIIWQAITSVVHYFTVIDQRSVTVHKLETTCFHNKMKTKCLNMNQSKFKHGTLEKLGFFPVRVLRMIFTLNQIQGNEN